MSCFMLYMGLPGVGFGWPWAVQVVPPQPPPGRQPGRTSSFLTSDGQYQSRWISRRGKTTGYMRPHGESLIRESSCTGILTNISGALGDESGRTFKSTGVTGQRWMRRSYNQSLPLTHIWQKRHVRRWRGGIRIPITLLCPRLCQNREDDDRAGCLITDITSRGITYQWQFTRSWYTTQCRQRQR